MVFERGSFQVSHVAFPLILLGQTGGRAYAKNKRTHKPAGRLTVKPKPLRLSG